MSYHLRVAAAPSRKLIDLLAGRDDDMVYAECAADTFECLRVKLIDSYSGRSTAQTGSEMAKTGDKLE